MTETYFKAVRPDGTDFHTGTVRWLPPVGESLPDDGLVVTHPTSRREPSRRVTEQAAATYLSVSTNPTECTGMEWPCRLARVERTSAAVWAPGPYYLPNKRASWQWRVVEELDPTLALGPQGAEVVAIIERAGRLTDGEVEALDVAWEAAWNARGACADVWTEAWTAAWFGTRADVQNAALEAVRDAARCATEIAAEVAACEDAQCVAGDAALAALVRDLIDDPTYQLLAGPWNKVIGDTND